jgi:hypothetical protein
VFNSKEIRRIVLKGSIQVINIDTCLLLFIFEFNLVFISEYSKNKTMENKDFLKHSTLSLSDIENTDSEILKRIANDLEDSQAVGRGHSSHSSSSGRGHSSFVSGAAAKADNSKEK